MRTEVEISTDIARGYPEITNQPWWTLPPYARIPMYMTPEQMNLHPLWTTYFTSIGWPMYRHPGTQYEIENSPQQAAAPSLMLANPVPYNPEPVARPSANAMPPPSYTPSPRNKKRSRSTTSSSPSGRMNRGSVGSRLSPSQSQAPYTTPVTHTTTTSTYVARSRTRVPRNSVQSRSQVTPRSRSSRTVSPETSVVAGPARSQPSPGSGLFLTISPISRSPAVAGPSGAQISPQQRSYISQESYSRPSRESSPGCARARGTPRPHSTRPRDKKPKHIVKPLSDSSATETKRARHTEPTNLDEPLNLSTRVKSFSPRAACSPRYYNSPNPASIVGPYEIHPDNVVRPLNLSRTNIGPQDDINCSLGITWLANLIQAPVRQSSNLERNNSQIPAEYTERSQANTNTNEYPIQLVVVKPERSEREKEEAARREAEEAAEAIRQVESYIMWEQRRRGDFSINAILNYEP